MKNLLLIIDPQNDFFDGGSLEVRGSTAIIPNINNLINSNFFNQVVVTLDQHPADHKSFASQHGKELFSIIDLNGVNQVLWPDHCVQYTSGADIHPELCLPKSTVYFKKGMNKEVDSYSGFFDNSRNKTGLAEELRAMNITNVFVCGLAMDYCCKFSALDSQLEGFNTFFISDATMPVLPDAIDSVNSDLMANNIHTVSTEAILNGRNEIILDILSKRMSIYEVNHIRTSYADCISDLKSILNALK